jgi:hypothetical protein
MGKFKPASKYYRIIKRCPECGRSFSAESDRKTYCSNRCKNNACRKRGIKC